MLTEQLVYHHSDFITVLIPMKRLQGLFYRFHFSQILIMFDFFTQVCKCTP